MLSRLDAEEQRGAFVRVQFKNGVEPIDAYLWNVDPITGTVVLFSPPTESCDDEDSFIDVHMVMADALKSIMVDENADKYPLEDVDQLLLSRSVKLLIDFRYLKPPTCLKVHEVKPSSTEIDYQYVHAFKHQTTCCRSQRNSFKARFPENTMLAFHEAIRSGCDALETDVRLSSDKVVCISHDITLKRVFNAPGRIPDYSYQATLSKLYTVQQPAQKMPTLEDVLHLLVQHQDVGLILDIKPDNNIEIIDAVVQTLRKVNEDMSFWRSRVLLGIWTHPFLSVTKKVAPELPICHIGIDHRYAMQHFVPCSQVVAISINVTSFLLRSTNEFRRSLEDNKTRLFTWTVNNNAELYLACANKCDAVLTDDPVFARSSMTPSFLSSHWWSYNLFSWLRLLYVCIKLRILFLLIYIHYARK
ncbi:glycerophosphoryl diester phosphodiesterase [Schizosaccharomyces japonicus yFS275]|uniref:Glycerophosphoryl diester phosphodiesterase n=1 Tax=Schizosaccharomyces japonicus (strain yFS275 / FY16936) TaxID=402676 RepID=B6K1Q0_SCHJY|nr:glycerophosphoryl diester phosphodiesterase [Schizosaccharomyces japonicus yFS275]EEB07081.1 glycerophosphoryl diester phosphodiesterase [Schizosaccharomyces japonicus yFS275]